MRILIGVLIAGLLVVAAGSLFILFGFFLSARSALETPSAMQIGVAEAGKNFLVPGDVAKLSNPVASSPETLDAARRAYNSRCAVCHGNDGKATTATGSNTYPPAADLTAARTQGKADGMLYWIIENGLPHTAMPGWKKVLKDEEIWGLVSYVRQLPKGVPAAAEVVPTSAPTAAPTIAPTTVPTSAPTAAPTAAPTTAPTSAPAAQPTTAPTAPPPTAAPPPPTAAPAQPTAVAKAAAPAQAQAPAAKSNNTVTINISDYAYQPDRITVPVGTTVVWSNQDDEAHDVTSEGGPNVLSSPDFGKGGSFSFTFNQPGEYKYYCVPHDYMHGVVVVR